MRVPRWWKPFSSGICFSVYSIRLYGRYAGKVTKNILKIICGSVKKIGVEMIFSAMGDLYSAWRQSCSLVNGHTVRLAKGDSWADKGWPLTWKRLLFTDRKVTFCNGKFQREISCWLSMACQREKLWYKPKSVIRPTYSNILLLLYGLFVRFAFLFAVLLPVPSRHSPLCLRRNGCNTTEIKTKRNEI